MMKHLQKNNTQIGWAFAKPVALLAAAMLLAACSSFQHVVDGRAQFPNPSASQKTKGVTATPQQLAQLQVGMTKQQVYDVLGTPHFTDGMLNNRYWDYVIHAKDPRANNAVVDCQLKLQWAQDAARTQATLQALYWDKPQCPPTIAPTVVTRDVVREVVREVRVPVEVIKEVIRVVPATAPAPSVSAAAAVVAPASKQFSQSIQLEAYFAHNGSSGSDLLPESKQRLEAFAARLKAGGQLQSVDVVGHADRTGDEAGNQRLAQERADTVAAFLMRTVGQPMKTASVGARSSREAVVVCTGLQGKALEGCLQPNRRVVIEAVAIK